MFNLFDKKEKSKISTALKRILIVLLFVILLFVFQIILLDNSNGYNTRSVKADSDIIIQTFYESFKTDTIDRFLEENKKEEPILTLPVLKQKATRYDDLANFDKITEKQMNFIIDKFDALCGGTPFKNNGDIFIEASEISGLNPLYIFAHACIESNYGKSQLAMDKGNYFGIAAFDTDPNAAYVMANTMKDGIINGALWIKENFYDNTQISLYDMQFKYEDHIYASAGDKWINDILWVMNKYSLMTEEI